MAKRTSKPKGETADATPTAEKADAAPRDVDRVAMPSIKADGTPDQTDGYERLVPDGDDQES